MSDSRLVKSHYSLRKANAYIPVIKELLMDVLNFVLVNNKLTADHAPLLDEFGVNLSKGNIAKMCFQRGND